MNCNFQALLKMMHWNAVRLFCMVDAVIIGPSGKWVLPAKHQWHELDLQDKVLSGMSETAATREVTGFLDGSELEAYKHTAFAGRVAAASGVARLAALAGGASGAPSKQASKLLHRINAW